MICLRIKVTNDLGNYATDYKAFILITLYAANIVLRIKMQYNL